MTTLTSAYAVLQHATIGNQGNARVDDAPYYRPEKKCEKVIFYLLCHAQALQHHRTLPMHMHPNELTVFF